MSSAIGMIETKGLVGSYEAADAMIKSSDVTIVKQEFVDGGIVTVVVKGDVGSVQAAVEAGKAAAMRVGELLGAHVIPRPDDEVFQMISGPEVPKKKPASTSTSTRAKKTTEATPATDNRGEA
ncbi:BMC domain-containing protein [Lysinibacillus fusiformis]|uniref:BMC domain-containing protein n=1 Tax=Lysinibacillus fusiformis TaxID=28031 RepID=UPI000E82C0C1|nr:BMC domain-containing protein [Lysinibacillus fusiformis]MCG7434598.1 BMC domain-containing protein [Lysinibacillus fusiformis]HAU33022.1 ethanolamine utilization protein [Lysinibacillus sp.]